MGKDRTHVSVWNYILNADKTQVPDEDVEYDSSDDKPEFNPEITISQSPKINCYLAQGFYDQISRNKGLITLKLLHFQLHTKCWSLLGKGLAESNTLQSFTAQATNLAKGDNMLLLLTGSSKKGKKHFEGLIKNKSLQVLDLSDNDLRDSHGELLLEFIRI